jgi:hypothetical protein
MRQALVAEEVINVLQDQGLGGLYRLTRASPAGYRLFVDRCIEDLSILFLFRLDL